MVLILKTRSIVVFEIFKNVLLKHRDRDRRYRVRDLRVLTGN